MPITAFASATALAIGNDGSSESSSRTRATFCAIVRSPSAVPPLCPPPLPLLPPLCTLLAAALLSTALTGAGAGALTADEPSEVDESLRAQPYAGQVGRVVVAEAAELEARWDGIVVYSEVEEGTRLVETLAEVGW